MFIGGLFKSFSESINRAVPLILWTSHNTCAYEPNPTSVSHSLTCDSFHSIGELGRAMIRKNYRTTIISKIRKSCQLRLSKVLKMFDLILLNFSAAQLPLICAFPQVTKLDPKYVTSHHFVLRLVFTFVLSSATIEQS